LDPLELVLVAGPLPILVGCVVWFVLVSVSQQKGKRLNVKWRDMSPVRKTVVGLIAASICFNLYLTVGNELAFLNVAVLPLSWIYSLASPVVVWGVTTTVVGLAVFFDVKFPRRPVVS
jgi:hypothetical protein